MPELRKPYFELCICGKRHFVDGIKEYHKIRRNNEKTHRNAGPYKYAGL